MLKRRRGNLSACLNESDFDAISLPKVMYEDDYLLVLDKPAGWITNSADTTANQPVVEKWIEENFRFQIFDFPLLRHGVVHRLDKETSGILLIAKTKDAFEFLQRQFKERAVQKKYVALLHGDLEEKSGKIETGVGRLPWRRDRFGIVPGGRNAYTEYKVVGSYRLLNAKPHLRDYSLVEFYPKTGRTHQIRIHSKYIGHPIVGDAFYAGRKTAREDRKWCPRLFLHASEILFLHPADNKMRRFVSDIPRELICVIKQLEKVS
jgi:23S rRNA pseudouridine1911/1915/1917 synthase